MIDRFSKSSLRLYVIVLVFIPLILGACSPFADSVQPSVFEQPLIVAPGQSVGQTFVATYNGLQGVTLTYTAERAITLDCALRTSPNETSDLRFVSKSLNPASVPTPVEITFDPVRDSDNAYYYFYCAVPASASPISFSIGTARTYQQGSIHHEHEPGDAQLTFQLLYDRSLVVWTLVCSLLVSFWRLLLVLLAYVLPGWALLVYLFPDSQRTFPESVGLSVGISVALYPVLFWITHIVGLSLGWLNTWLPVSAAVTALFLRYKLWKDAFWKAMWIDIRDWFQSEKLLVDVTWIIVVASILTVRFIVVRTLDAPLWGDSYQHTVITQLMIERGGLFDSWKPYAPLTSFTYHFGFHANMAVLHWATGLNATQSVLWGGQLLNGLAVVTLTPLASRLNKHRWTTVYTVVVAGVLTSMPMYYTNWGRYTQLAGFVILPVAMLLSLDLLRARKRHRDGVWLAWLVVGGLSLTHLRVLLFYIAFVIAWFFIEWDFSSFARLRVMLRARVSRIAWLAIGGLLIFLPWLIRGYGGGIQQNFVAQMKVPANGSAYLVDYNAVGPLRTYMSPLMWILMFAGAMLALWYREKLLRLVVVWVFVLLLMTNPAWLRLPGTGAISNFALYIGVYIPAALMIAYFSDLILSFAYDNRYLRIGVTLLSVLIALYGVNVRRHDIHADIHALVTRNDIQAGEWIQDNLPETAVFWTNGFPAYGNTVVVGSDAGWWLPIIAERQTVIPPINYGTEFSDIPDLKLRLLQTVADLQLEGVDSAAFIQSLRDFGVTHIYVGQLQGRVNYAGPGILEPQALVDSPLYTPIYHEDRVWIFELNGATVP